MPELGFRVKDMKDKRAFFPARSRLLLGFAFLLVASGLASGQWYSVRGPLQDLAWFEEHRAPGDSVAYASALYHASYARAIHARRWSPTGYATLGLAGALVGAALIVSSFVHRTT